MSATDEDITIKGYLQYKEKKSWKRMWFVVKDKVLYTYKASEDVAAESTFPLIGFNVSCENVSRLSNNYTHISEKNDMWNRIL